MIRSQFRPLRPRVGSLALFLSALSCDDAPPPGGGGRLAIDVAAYELPGVTDACYTLEVRSELGETVWRREGICASRYGSGADIAYVATCDATDGADPDSDASNVVVLTLDEDGLLGPGGRPLDDFRDPCAAPYNPAGCQQTIVCRENEDQRVTFNLTLMREANQGFFDVAVTFEDVFCSAKVDCVGGDGAPLALLHHPDTGVRGQTAVVALACTGGPGGATRLLHDPIAITCAAPATDLVLDPGVGPGNAWDAAPEGSPVWQYAVYAGNESLRCNGGDCAKQYWNVAIGFDPSARDCELVSAATALDATSHTGFATPTGTSYPIIDYRVQLTGPDGGLVCSRHPLDGEPAGTSSGYTDFSGGRPFGSAFDGTSFAATASAPSAPRNVHAVAADGSALVSWDTPVSDGGSAVTGYVVTSVPPSAGCTTTGATQCTVAGLANGVAYVFAVRAENGAGAGPDAAAVASVVPAGLPGRPTILSAVAGDGAATITWSVPDDGGSVLTGYVVSVLDEGGVVRSDNVAVDSTTATLTGLANGRYTFTVAAVNAVGPGPASNASAEVLLNAAPNAFEAGSLVLSFSTVEGSLDLSSYGGNVDAYPAGWVSDKAVLVWQALPSQMREELAGIFVPGKRFAFTQTIMGGGTQTISYAGTVANVVPQGFMFQVEFIDETDWPEGLPCCFTTEFTAAYNETATGEPGQSLLVNAPTTTDPDGDALGYANSWQVERPDLGGSPDGWHEVQGGGDSLTVTSDMLRPLLSTPIRVVRTAADGNGGATTIASNVLSLPKLNSAPTAGQVVCDPSSIVQSQQTWVDAPCSVTGYADPDGDAPVITVASTTCVASNFTIEDSYLRGYFQDSAACSVTLALTDAKGAVYAPGATTVAIDVAPIAELRLLVSPSTVYVGGTATVQLQLRDTNGTTIIDSTRIAALELSVQLSTSGSGAFASPTLTKAVGVGTLPTTSYTAGNGSGVDTLSALDGTHGWEASANLTVNPYVVQAAMGFVHGCARMSDGTVKCAGNNRHGQLGNGLVDNSDTTYQPQTVAGLTGVIDISGEYEATCAVTSAGEVWCWGYNSSHAIQPGGPTDIPTPFKVPGVSDAVRVFVTWSQGTYILRGPPGGRYVTTIGDNVFNPSLAGDLSTVVELGTTDTSLCVRRANGTWGCTNAAVVPVGATGQLLSKLRLRSTNTDQVCALRQDGVLHCRSDVNDGSDGAVSGSSGLGLDGKTNVSAFDTGGFHICAVSGGVVECRGDTRGYSGINGANGIADVFLGTYTACTLGTNKDFNCYSGWGGYGTQLGNL